MKIAIIGCGPAGLSCALQLSKQDHQITIFERMNDLSMQGSGVLIQPIGLAALDILGIREEIEQCGQPIHLYAKTRKSHVIFYQTMARILTPFYQSDNSVAIYCRDRLYGPLCKIPQIRTLTAQLMSGQIRNPLKLTC